MSHKERIVENLTSNKKDSAAVWKKEKRISITLFTFSIIGKLTDHLLQYIIDTNQTELAFGSSE